MKNVIKILLAYDAPDDLAARSRFRQAARQIAEALPEDLELRDFKVVEDGSGRLIDKYERAGEANQG